MSDRFAALFRGWLEREGITRSQASARLGTAVQVPYGYADGTNLPQRRYLPELARKMGVPEAELVAAVDADRAARRAAAAGSGGAAPTSAVASAPPAAPVRAGW
jgi:hypothetical protein